MASRPALVVGPPGDGVATKQLLMPSQDVVAGLHWPSPDFGDSATWEFDPGRVYRQASRRCRNPWGLWTSPKGRPNGWSQCTAAKELGSIGDHHWEITIDVSDMLSLVCAEDVPDEYRWDVTELGVGLESWEVRLASGARRRIQRRASPPPSTRGRSALPHAVVVQARMRLQRRVGPLSSTAGERAVPLNGRGRLDRES